LIYDIHIFVRSISGKSIILDVNSTDIIRNIKEQIYDKEGILIKQQKITFGKQFRRIKGRLLHN
jgi:ubiquitin C